MNLDQLQQQAARLLAGLRHKPPPVALGVELPGVPVHQTTRGRRRRPRTEEQFTSTKATATLGTIYWTASFTLTPGECESPSTFTTPVRTLVVAPSAAELAAAKRHQEEVAAKKLEEEAAAKKEEEAAAGSVVLAGSRIGVEDGREAAVKLTGAPAG